MNEPEPFNEVEEVTRCAMAVCAARLDDSIDGSEFSGLVERLIRVARSEGYRAGVVVRREQIVVESPKPAAPQLSAFARGHGLPPLPRNGHWPKLGAEVSPQPLPPDDEPADDPAVIDAQAERATLKKGGYKLDAAAKQSIRAKYLEATNEGTRRPPRGFVSDLARAHHVTGQTIYATIRDLMPVNGTAVHA